MGITPRSNVDEKQQFYQKLCEYEDHALRMIYEYFQDDLLSIVENLNTKLLLAELHSQNIPDVEKYKSLENDIKTLAKTLLQDIFLKGREAVIGLWVSLFVLRSSHDLPSLDAVLDELCQTGDTLVEKIVLDEYGHQLPPELKTVQECHKNHLHEKTKTLIENKLPGCNQEEESFSFCTRYVNLIIVSTKQFRERSENELIETGVKHEEYTRKTQNELQRITPNKMFRCGHQSRHVPHMVMVSGVPGVGKTTLMQKFVYDWVTGKLYQRFSFVFFFKFRELNRLEDKVTLETMILNQYPYLEGQLGNILQDPEKLLFIFDGLDESSHDDMDFRSSRLCSNYKQAELCGQIIVSLVRKSLLNGCSVLMTSRPTRLALIDCCNVFQRMVEIIGFFPEERQMYFENFFNNTKELAEKAFNYVRQNDTLYTFCYLPSYCWIICTVLSKSFQPTSSAQRVSLLPKTVTQLFAIFVANILSNHSLYQSDAQKLLRSIGWMAEYGVMNHKVIFDHRHLGSFQVNNKSKLLSSFLMESEEPVYYSFLHLTVQEFLSAFVHYADYTPVRLQKSLKEARSYSDGRGEIFLRFLCGLSDSSTRSILSGYLDVKATMSSRDVITWVKNFLSEENKMMGSIDNKRRLLTTFFYLFETRNKALVLDTLKSYTVFDLSGIHLSALDCTVLAFILQAYTSVEKLDLTECSINAEGLERLAPVLHNLQNLRLVKNNLPEMSCIQLASIIRNSRSLKTLGLAVNNLSGPHFSDLMEALSSPDCTVANLQLDDNKLQGTSCAQLASGLSSNQSLKILNLSNNNLSGPQFNDLIKALSNPTCRIEKLHLNGNDLPEIFCIQLALLIRNNQSLKTIGLSGNHLSGPRFSDLMEALSSPDCRIEKLHLARIDLQDSSCIQLASVIRNNQSLKILGLSGNHLSGPHFSDLMAALSSSACSIEELRMWDNGLTEEEKDKIKTLERRKPNLKIRY
ncbi:NACHT, LRR and PYD domains-containing protein 12-like isoform X1 [Ranitomeya variabilis]|uniref:NACHT, LRR and PYD domains-containing protein 12-like isoform X1 n=1 Tax=Ranitomeya variabilis TaxID=490064 RepID=UPI00405752C8